MTLSSNSFAATGDSFLTDHGSFTVVNQPEDILLGPGESLDVDITVRITCDYDARGGAAQPLMCGEVCAKGVIANIYSSNHDIIIDDILGGADISPSSPGGPGGGPGGGTPIPGTGPSPSLGDFNLCDSLDEIDDFGAGSEERTYTIRLSAPATFDDAPFVLNADFRMIDLGAPSMCTSDGFVPEFFGGPSGGGSDSGRIVLQIGGNGAINFTDGDTARTSEPGEAILQPTYDNCISEKPCPAWVDLTGCFDQGAHGCWEYQGYLDPDTNHCENCCPMCDFDNLVVTQIHTGDILVYESCPVLCEPGLDYIDGVGCACPDGSEPDPANPDNPCVACPTGQMLDSASGECLCPDGNPPDPETAECLCADGFPTNSAGTCECPAPVEWTAPVAVFSTTSVQQPARKSNNPNRFKHYQHKMCDPFRPRLQDQGVFIESNEGFFAKCTGKKKINFLREPSFAPTLIFDQNPELQTDQCTYDLSIEPVLGTDYLYPNSTLDLRWSTPDTIATDTVDFDRFKLRSTFGRSTADTSSVVFNVSVDHNERGAITSYISQFEVCDIPTGMTIDHWNQVHPGLVEITPKLLPLTTNFRGRRVQEYIVESQDSDTCRSLLRAKHAQLDAMAQDPTTFENWHCPLQPGQQLPPGYTVIPSGFSPALTSMLCPVDGPGGKLTTEEEMTLQDIAKEGVMAVDTCAQPGSTSNNSPFVQVGAHLWHGHDSVGYRAIPNDSCTQMMRQIAIENGGECEDAANQYFRITCDSTRGDGALPLSGNPSPRIQNSIVFTEQSLITRYNHKRLTVFYGRERLKLDEIDHEDWDHGDPRIHAARTIWWQ